MTLGSVLGVLGLGWRIIFLINLPIGIAALIAGRAYLPQARSDHPAGNDYGGIVLFGGAMALVLWPLMQADEAGRALGLASEARHPPTKLRRRAHGAARRETRRRRGAAIAGASPVSTRRVRRRSRRLDSLEPLRIAAASAASFS
jgi:hypothetical protein